MPIGELVTGVDLPDVPAPTRRERAPQARRHFAQLDQIAQLVAARDADPELGFMARLLALCSLPRTNPGNRLQYVRRNGPYTLGMSAGINNRLPYGTRPRLLLAWVCTEAVRTQSRELILGDSLSEFMRKVGIYSTSGDKHTRLRNQMRRLFGCTVELIYQDEHGERSIASRIADRTEFWWNPKRPDDRTLWNSKIELGEKFFHEVITNPVPIDLNTLRAMKRSPLGLDLYLLAHVSHVRTQAPAAAYVAAALPAVRRRPGQVERQVDRERFSKRLSARAAENQGRVAGPALLDGQGRVDSFAITATHRAVATAPRGIVLAPL